MAINQTGKWDELGTVGLGLSPAFGFVQKAYINELTWPSCYPVYNRIRRADPEIAVVRSVFQTMSPGVTLQFELDDIDEPTDDDNKALEFANSTLADMDFGAFRDTAISHVPFMGWAWFQIVPGLRRSDWKPPQDDTWRSQFDDGLIGARRFAFRDHSTFYNWKMNDQGRVIGMNQSDPPHPLIELPAETAVHLTYGDANNPEGLSPLEAVYRLERIKYGLEVVNGIGFEHAAGYLNVQKTAAGELSPDDKANIRAAARAILTAQEGNYAAWPFGIAGEVKDVPFGAAASLLEAIRYYGLLKLAVYNMQWIALSSISGTGSFAAMSDASEMWLTSFNAMWTGLTKQIDQQYGAWLFKVNAAAFPNLTKRPVLKCTPLPKSIKLADLGAFLSSLNGILPLGDDDMIEIRKRSGFLPETLPESQDVAQVTAAESTTATATDEGDAEDAIDNSEMSQRLADLAVSINKATEKLDHDSA